MERLTASAETLIAQLLDVADSVHISSSGGKDSIVVQDIVHRVAPDTPVVWEDCELVFPEHLIYMEQLHDSLGGRYVHLLGSADYAYGGYWPAPWRDTPYYRDYPSCATAHHRGHRGHLMAIGRYTADVMGSDGLYWGLRADESPIRAALFEERGPLYIAGYPRQWRCAPLWNWTHSDVWDYILAHRLQYSPVYDIIGNLLGTSPTDRRIRLAEMPYTPEDIVRAGWPDEWEALRAKYGDCPFRPDLHRLKS